MALKKFFTLAFVFFVPSLAYATSPGTAAIVTIDSSSYTAGSSPFSPVGGVYNDSIQNLNPGTTGAGRLTATRGAHVNLRDSSGNELGTPSNPVATVSSFTVNGSTVQANIIGTVPVSVTNVTTSTIDNLPAITTVTFSGTQPVSGTVSVDNLPALTTTTFNGISQPVNITNVTTTTVSNLPAVTTTTFNGVSQPVNLTNSPAVFVSTVQVVNSTVAVSGFVTPPTVIVSSAGVNASTVAAVVINQPTIANTGFNVNNLPAVTTVTFNGASQPVNTTSVSTVTFGGTAQPVNSTSVNISTVTFNGVAQPVNATSVNITTVTFNGVAQPVNATSVNVATVTFNNSSQPVHETSTSTTTFAGATQPVNLTDTTGLSVGDYYNPVRILSAQGSAFGEDIAVAPTPIVQVMFPYGINALVTTTTVVGAGQTSWANGLASIATGGVNFSSATIQSIKRIRYNPGQGGLVRFTAIFTTCTANTQQLAGVGTISDGFFFGCNGNQFGVLRRSASVDTWTPQTSWNTDKMDGTGKTGMNLDITKGNVYEIRYQWLGFGNINFSVEDNTTGRIDRVHIIRYPNTSTATSVQNPNFPIYFFVGNGVSASTVTLQTASWGGFVEGLDSDFGIEFATTTTKTIGTTETPVIAIRNATTFHSLTNESAIHVGSILATMTGAANAFGTFKCYINPVLTGASFQNVDATNSIAQIDVSASSFSGGRLHEGALLSNNTSEHMDLDQQFDLNPGDTILITAVSSQGTATDGALIQWREKF